MSWLEKNGKLLAGLNKNVSLLVAIATLREHFQAQGNAHDFDQLAQALNSLEHTGSETDAVKRVLRTKDLNPDFVSSQWEAIKERAGDNLAEKYQALVYSLSELENPPAGVSSTISWPLLDAPDSDTDSGKDTPFSLLGEATLQVEASPGNESMPEAFPAALLPENNKLLRISMNGEFNLIAEATFPVSDVLSAAVSGKGGGNARLHWFFANAQHQMFALALYNSAGNLAQTPFDLASMTKLLRNSETPLTCLDIQINGVQEYSGAMDICKPGIPLGTLVSADVRSKFEYRLKRRGEYRCLVYKNDEGNTTVHMGRGRSKEEESFKQFEVDFDFTPLYKDWFDLVIEKNEKIGTLAEKLKNILPRDNAIKNGIEHSLEQEIKESGVREALKTALGYEKEFSLSQLLTHKLMTEVETSTARWSSKSDIAAERAAEAVLGELSLTGENAAAVRGLVVPKIKEMIAKENTRFESEIKNLIADNQQWTNLVMTLESYGQDLDQHITDLNERFNQIVGSMREMVTQFQTQVTRIRDALIIAANSKLKLKWSHEQARSESVIADAVVVFSDDSAESVYDEILSGSLNTLTKVILHPEAFPSVRVQGGELTQTIGTQDKSGFEIGLFGMTHYRERSLSVDASCTVSSNGDIRAYSRGQIEASRSVLGESRRLAFIDVYELITAKKHRSLSIDLTVSQYDESVSLKDVQGFFYSLESEDLLASGVTSRALERLKNANERFPGARIKGRLDVGFALNGSDLDYLLGDMPDKSAIMSLVAEELARVDSKASVFGNSYRERHKDIERYFPDLATPLPSDLHSLILTMDDDTASTARTDIQKLGRLDVGQKAVLDNDVRLFNQYHRHALNIVNLLNEVYAVYNSDQNTNEWDVNRYEAVQSRIDACLKEWLKIGDKFLFFLPDEIRPLTISFMRICARLCGKEFSRDQSLMSARLALGDNVFDLVT